MRPQSIVMFERLFLGSLALSTLSYTVSYNTINEAAARDPAMGQLGLGGGFVIVMFAVGTGIFLLLWYLIARKAVNGAKWVLVALLLLSLVSLVSSLLRGFSLDLASLLSLAVYALEVAATAYLFRDDAKAWLKGERSTDPAAFD